MPQAYNKRMLLEGIFAAATTPFYPDSRLYLRKLEHNMERYSRTPVSGIVVLGSTGEAAQLDDAETRETLRTAAVAASLEKVLVAGIGQQGALPTLRLAEFAASVNYDAVLVRTPFYYAPHMSPLAMLTYFRTVADNSPLPVILYSIPKFTHYDLPVEVIAELAQHPNIIGLKDSSGSVERIAAISEATREMPRKTFDVTSVFTAVTRRMHAAALAPKEPAAQLVTIGGTRSEPLAPSLTNPPVVPNPKWRTRTVPFQILCGAADQLLPSLQSGATGAVLALAAPAPQACHEVYIAWKEKDEPLALEKQQRIVLASQIVAGKLGIAGIKAACDLNGYYGGRPRLPLLPLTGEEQAEVARTMRDLRN